MEQQGFRWGVSGKEAAAGIRSVLQLNDVQLGLGVLCFYFCAIMLLSIMLSEFTILECDYATYMLA